MTLHDTDFHAWTREQAELLRRRSANALDWDQLAEELDCLGASEVRELRSRFIVLMAHLLKWEFQPQRSKSWRVTIENQRRDIADHISKNPSLKSLQDAEFARAYSNARSDAYAETDLPLRAFPTEPPWSREQACKETFWPGGPPVEDGAS